RGGQSSRARKAAASVPSSAAQGATAGETRSNATARVAKVGGTTFKASIARAPSRARRAMRRVRAASRTSSEARPTLQSALLAAAARKVIETSAAESAESSTGLR